MDSTPEKKDGKPVRAAWLESLLSATGDTETGRVAFRCRVKGKGKPAEEVEIVAPLGSLTNWLKFRRAALSQGWILKDGTTDEWDCCVFKAVQAGEVAR